MPSRCRSRSPERVRGCRRRAGMRKLGKRTASFLRSPWMALVPALAIVLGLERKASEGESGWWLSHRTARLGVQVAVGVAGAVVVWSLSRRPPPAAPEAPAAAAAAAPPPSPGTARAQQEMSQAELSAAFARTTEAVRSGDARLGKPLQEDLLHLYALFKQATQGDCCTPRPSVLEVAAVTKWDAWHSQLGMPIHTAMTAYIELVDQLSVGNTGAEAEAEAADGSAFDPAAWFGGFGGIGLKGGLAAGGDWYSESGEGGLVRGRSRSGSGSGSTGEPPLWALARDGELDKVEAALAAAAAGGAKEPPEPPEEAGAVDDRDEAGRTALYWAADRGHTAVVASLLRHGASVDSQGDDGQTALHCAIVCEFQDVAEQLLKAGANALLPDNDGDTALTLAREMLSSDHPLRDRVEAYAAAVHVKD